MNDENIRQSENDAREDKKRRKRWGFLVPQQVSQDWEEAGESLEESL
jgi:hypothetical protein